MKKLTLFLVAMLFSALSFAALNPYAYGLKSTLSSDQKTLTVEYSLNAPATSVVWKLMDGDKVVKTLDLTAKGLANGLYTIAIPTLDFPVGKNLTWTIDVKGVSVSTPTKLDTEFSFYLPYGMDVDVDPESDHLGNWYVIEASNDVKTNTKYSAYESYKVGRGLYAFDAVLQPILNKDGNKGFNGGGINIGYTEQNINEDYVNLYRVSTSGGRVFIGKYRKDHAAIVEADPANLNNKFTEVLNDGTRAVSIDARGSGNDLKLVMLATDNKIYEYDLGTAKSIPTYSRTLNKSGLTVARDDASIVYDNAGGVWFNQNRGNANTAQPTIAHISANGVDYNNVTAGLSHLNTNNSGIAVRPDGKQLAVVGAGAKNITIYDITTGSDGKITLIKAHTITVPSGSNHTALAFDYAGNLFAANRSAEKIRFYAMPYSGLVSTPCASKYAFTLDANSASASELNPFAYDLSSTWNSTSKTLTVNYSLNANATGVDIVIMDGKMEVKRVACSGKTRGTHTEVISAEGLSMNRKFTWKVDVKGTSKSVPTKVSTMYSLWGPYGLDIDKNPESEYFGRILVTEAYHGVKDLNGYISTGQGAGLYVFNPAFGTDGKVCAGAENFASILGKNVGFQPFRVRISEDGRIFVTSLDINGVAVWEVSKDLQTWTPLLAGTNNSSDYRIYYNTSTFLAAPNASIDVTGTGDELKLLLYSASKESFPSTYSQKWFRLDEYSMDGVETGKAFPTSNAITSIKAFNGYNMVAGNSTKYKYGVLHNHSVVIYDGEGGYWFAGNRSADNATQPNLAHVNASGTQDYYNTSSQIYGGAGLLIHDHSTVGKVLIKGTKPSGTFKIYLLEKNADGTPKLTEKWTVTSGIGTNHNAFAIDYAENLYTIGNSGEKIAAFALPYDGEVSTPAMDKYSFTIYAGYTPAATDQLNPFAYALSSELIDGGMNLKVNYKLNATANSAKVVIMNGTTEVKTVDCTELTKGTHTLTIPTEGLPTNTDLTWKVVVNGTSVTKVQEYSTKHSLSYPSAIDIDNNPNNETFGNILVVEALHASKEQIGLLSSNYGSGIFAFDATFANISKYNGNNVFTTGRTDANGSRAYAPHRLRISDDGRIFVTSLNTNGDVLWEVNPNDMNSWTPIFTGLTQDANKDLVNGSTFVAGPNAGFDVRGSGENLQLLMLSANTVSYSFGQTGFRVSEYNLGGNTSWNTAPSKAFPHENFLRSGVNRCYFISATGSQVQYDKDGGVWYIQNRAECTETMPGLVYFDRNGNEKYKAVRNDTRNAGFRFNHDFTKVAISDNTFVNIYSITKDPSGVPILTQELGIKLSSVGNNILDFVWDYANNLYVTGSTLSSGVYKGNAVAYRLPYSGEVTTPAASKYTFRVEYEVTVDENANNTTALAPFVGETVTANVVRNFAPNSVLTLTLPFDMNAAQISTFFGNAKVYEFATIVEDEYEIHLQFSSTSSISAGKPYILVTPTTGGYDAEDGFTIENVTINTTPTPVTVGATITMVPALDAVGTLDQNNQYYLSGGGLYNAGTYNMAIVGLRAYFESTSPLPVRARVVFQDNEATSIPMVEAQSENNVRKVMKNGQLIIIRGEQKYNVQGQRME